MFCKCINQSFSEFFLVDIRVFIVYPLSKDVRK